MAANKRLVRKRAVEGRDAGTYVRIEITVAADSLELTSDEVNRLADNLTDKALFAIHDAPHFSSPVHKIKARSLKV